MHIHILGICGTFMGGIAAIAKALGHKVTGSDNHVYPPMSTQLAQLGITLFASDDIAQFSPAPDIVVIGNALSRGHPAVEYVLNRRIPYTSGPEWLREHVLQHKWVLAVAGTHGKTTTSSMLAWILEAAGYQPGYLIGGVPENFGVSARSSASDFFVIEADEYDCAFFDKRAKFVHYRPSTLIINNIEFDHADIYPSLDAIQTQFHHLIRTVPSQALVLSAQACEASQQTLARGCWSDQQQLGREWQMTLLAADGSHFSITGPRQQTAEVHWPLIGVHNAHNAVMAIAAAHHVGVAVTDAADALARFKTVKRRMELRGSVGGVHVYDDFAHHPTAIATTLDGLRRHVQQGRIVAVIEPRSNTMKLGTHRDLLADAWQQADAVWLLEPAALGWSLSDVVAHSAVPVRCCHNVADIISEVCAQAQAGDHIVIMSNGGFDNIHQRLLDALASVVAF